MVAALRVETLLSGSGIDYTSIRREEGAHPVAFEGVCDGEHIAKTLLLADGRGYALAVIPREREIDLDAMREEFGRSFRVAGSDEALRLFPGLHLRGLPPPGPGAELETFVDQSLVRLADVYFESADPRRLVHVDGEAFRNLLYGAWCGHISLCVAAAPRHAR